jgi:coproporphyrinogen III oxidase
MVTVGLQRSLAEDAPPATGPRARAGIKASFSVHADELFFKRKRLRFRGLGGVHGDETWWKMQQWQQLNAWHNFCGIILSSEIEVHTEFIV